MRGLGLFVTFAILSFGCANSTPGPVCEPNCPAGFLCCPGQTPQCRPANDPLNCGMCGRVCSSCVAGMCVTTASDSGVDGNISRDSSVDRPLLDISRPSQCDCRPGETCNRATGECSCGSGPACERASSDLLGGILGGGALGEVCCAGACVPTSAENCGACGNACSGDDQCILGAGLDGILSGGELLGPCCGRPQSLGGGLPIQLPGLCSFETPTFPGLGDGGIPGFDGGFGL